MDDPLSFLLTPAPPGPRTRAVILGELLAARTVMNDMIPEYLPGRGNTPPAAYKEQSWAVHGLKAELRAFDCATRSPLQLLEDDVQTSLQNFASAMATNLDQIVMESGEARSIVGWRLTAAKRLARAQAALAAFVPKRASIKAPQTPTPAALAAPVRSPAALARLAAHMEADRLTRLKSK